MKPFLIRTCIIRGGALKGQIKQWPSSDFKRVKYLFSFLIIELRLGLPCSTNFLSFLNKPRLLDIKFFQLNYSFYFFTSLLFVFRFFLQTMNFFNLQRFALVHRCSTSKRISCLNLKKKIKKISCPLPPNILLKLRYWFLLILCLSKYWGLSIIILSE